MISFSGALRVCLKTPNLTVFVAGDVRKERHMASLASLIAGIHGDEVAKEGA